MTNSDASFNRMAFQFAFGISIALLPLGFLVENYALRFALQTVFVLSVLRVCSWLRDMSTISVSRKEQLIETGIITLTLAILLFYSDAITYLIGCYRYGPESLFSFYLDNASFQGFTPSTAGETESVLHWALLLFIVIGLDSISRIIALLIIVTCFTSKFSISLILVFPIIAFSYLVNVYFLEDLPVLVSEAPYLVNSWIWSLIPNFCLVAIFGLYTYLATQRSGLGQPEAKV